jgi:hypothetical protein
LPSAITAAVFPVSTEEKGKEGSVKMSPAEEIIAARRLAERYAGTVVSTSFRPLAGKEEARQFAMDAWMAGFRKARELTKAESEGRPA